MKKKLIALALIIIVALAAMEGLYLLLRHAHAARQTAAPETSIGGALTPIAEVKADIVMHHSQEMRSVAMELEPPKEEPSGEPPNWEEMPVEQRAAHRASEAKVYDEMYARRFKLSVEEWKALSPKEKRHLIRKGIVK